MGLVKCPECNADVSPRARACPKCGGPLGYPDFYIKVSEYGLNLKNLICDYEARFEHNGGGLTADSPFGYVFTHNSEAVATTRTQVLAIYDEIDKRRTQISPKCEEFDELLLFKRYIGKLLAVCNPRNREAASMQIIIRDLETCIECCQHKGNAHCVQEAIDACKEFLATCC